MDPLWSEMLLVDAAHTFRFFAASLGEVIEGGARSQDGHEAGANEVHEVPHDEFLYVSSILAHYALVESGSAEYLPLPGALRELHDLYATDASTWHDPGLMETAAVQALMLTGYFAGGMRLRHNLGTYVRWGCFFFDRAASGTTGRKQAVLGGMSRHFPTWRHRLERLHVQLWENRHLLAFAQPPEPALAPRGRRHEASAGPS